MKTEETGPSLALFALERASSACRTALERAGASVTEGGFPDRCAGVVVSGSLRPDDVNPARASGQLPRDELDPSGPGQQLINAWVRLCAAGWSRSLPRAMAVVRREAIVCPVNKEGEKTSDCNKCDCDRSTAQHVLVHISGRKHQCVVCNTYVIVH